MSNEKRRGAAEVFREQNMANFDDEYAEADEVEEQAGYGLYDGLPQQNVMPAPQAPPAPAMSASYGGAVVRKPAKKQAAPLMQYFKTSEELQLETEPVNVRITGGVLFKRVIVPPNAYVVHTRLGKPDPITIGLGLSFRFNPRTDAYLVVPAAMQTIGVVANCISQEKQGINVLAYVQWQIADFSIAYRKLDFSNQRDPLGIVNAQLREQAEAAIKDKIATMSVEEVLKDKEPVIEELTTRLKAVSEGRAQNTGTTDEGLGIKIVTVQIKEALVSSQRLWENLQAPYRYEQEKSARISQLQTQDEIRQRELETRQKTQTSEAETQVEIERIKETKQTEALELRLSQEAARFRRQQQTDRERLQLEEETTVIRRESEQRLETQRLQTEQTQQIEQAQLNADAEIRLKAITIDEELAKIAEEARLTVIKFQAEQERIQQETELSTLKAALQQLTQSQQEQLKLLAQEAGLERQRREEMLKVEMKEAWLPIHERETELARLKKEVDNLLSQEVITANFIEKLPELTAHLPKVDELRILQTDGTGYNALLSFFNEMRFLLEQMNGFRVDSSGGSSSNNNNGSKPE